MAVLPARSVPLIDKDTRMMTREWYQYFFESSLPNQPIKTASYMQLLQMTAPANGGAKQARLFSRDNGGGKTQLAAIFPTGAIQTIVTEP